MTGSRHWSKCPECGEKLDDRDAEYIDTQGVCRDCYNRACDEFPLIEIEGEQDDDERPDDTAAE